MKGQASILSLPPSLTLPAEGREPAVRRSQPTLLSRRRSP